MTGFGPLFVNAMAQATAKVRLGAPATSHAAAVAIEPVSGRLRQRVYECIRQAGHWGRTDEEIQTYLDMNASTERPRRVELVESGHVKDSKRRRKTRSGRQAIVWVVTGGAR